jgi:hypothetical protein
MLNPYAAHLDDLDPLEVITATPARLSALIDAIGPDRATQPPAPGKWSARDILCHLADCEVVFAFRLRQGLAEDRHVIQPFDQSVWGIRYPGYRLEAALATFSALRQWNLALIRSLSVADLARPVNHPERGDMTIQTIVDTMGGHDRNHLKQVEALAA